MVSQWKDMVGTAFSLAIVGYVINLAMGRTLASKHGYDVDSNQVSPAAPGRAQGYGVGQPYSLPTNPAISPQEMIALGCSNFFGSFFKIHVICCALSVTLAVDGAGGKSQVSFVSGNWGRSEKRVTVPEKFRGHGHASLTQLASILPNDQLGSSQVSKPAHPSSFPD